MTASTIDWLVLTGGRGSRLGRDKATLVVGDQSLVDRSMASIASVDPGGDIRILGSEFPGGPAAAVARAVPECSSEFIGILAVDMPFVAPVLGAVVAAIGPAAEAWVPVDRDGRRHWLCAVYRREALDRVAGSAEWADRPFHRLVADLVCAEVTIESDASLLDVDTPEDLKVVSARIDESKDH